uniref:Uncharacterized protein n=1 Tax=Myotis myotis TaxID=51298 RepID=A0A7J7UPT5_MYOMY|nr:hypothetical protein mMyoMyo1_008678 [Myotis myotis]
MTKGLGSGPEFPGAGTAGQPDQQHHLQLPLQGSVGSRKALLTWLLQAWLQRRQSFLHFEVTEMPFGPWATMEQCIQLARQLGMLEWIYCEPASEQAPWPTPEDMPFPQDLHRHPLALARSSEMRL